MNNQIKVITIYEKPDSHPENFVAVEFIVSSGLVQASRIFNISKTLV